MNRLFTELGSLEYTNLTSRSLILLDVSQTELTLPSRSAWLVQIESTHMMRNSFLNHSLCKAEFKLLSTLASFPLIKIEEYYIADPQYYESALQGGASLRERVEFLVSVM